MIEEEDEDEVITMLYDLYYTIALVPNLWSADHPWSAEV